MLEKLESGPQKNTEKAGKTAEDYRGDIVAGNVIVFKSGDEWKIASEHGDLMTVVFKKDGHVEEKSIRISEFDFDDVRRIGRPEEDLVEKLGLQKGDIIIVRDRSSGAIIEKKVESVDEKYIHLAISAPDRYNPNEKIVSLLRMPRTGKIIEKFIKVIKAE